jgi:tetratricopeptide (TPR) repeat protein
MMRAMRANRPPRFERKTARQRAFLSVPISVPKIPVALGAALALVGYAALLVGSGALLTGCGASQEDRLAEVRVLQDQEGKIPESIELLRELISEGNRDGEVLYRYGMALSAIGKAGLSVWALDAAMEDPEWLVAAAKQLAFDANTWENFDMALETLDRLEAERSDPHEEDIESRLLEVRVLLNTRRRDDEALERVEEVLDDFPDHERALKLKTVALLRIGEIDEAYEMIRAAAKLATGKDLEADSTGDETGEEAEVAQASDETGEEAEVVQAADEFDAQLDLEGRERDSYWCAVRVTFKRENEELDEAARIAEACLADDPTSPALLNEAVRLFGDLGRPNRALELLVEAKQASPYDRDIRKGLVAYFAALGRLDEAEAMLRQDLAAVAENPQDAPPLHEARLWADLGGFLLDQERFEDGIEALDEVRRILGQQIAPDLLFRQADAMIRVGRYDDALEIADSTSVEVHKPMLRGRVAFERGDYATAAEELDRAALIWPDNARIRYYLARAAEGLGDFDRAIAEYRQAVRADSALSAARERLIKLHLAENRVRQAGTIIQFVSPRQQAKPSTALRVLEIEYQVRVGEEPNLGIPPSLELPLDELRIQAIDALARGIQRTSGEAAAESVLAALQEQTPPAQRNILVRRRVDLLLELDKPEAAVALARETLEKRPVNWLADLALGRALVRANQDLEEAEQRLQRVVAARPDEPDVHTGLGELAMLRDDLEDAARHLDRALELDPGDWEAMRARLDVFDKAGQGEEAVALLRHFVRRDAPYDARGALELARRLPDESAAQHEERIRLARQALRFGAGEEAAALLQSLAPTAAEAA